MATMVVLLFYMEVPVLNTLMGLVGLLDCHLFRVSFALVAPYYRGY